MDIDLEALIQNLLAESDESLPLMEESLLLLETRPDDQEALANVFRVVHTLKGDAAMVGFTGVAELAHRLEDLLDLLREGQARVTGPLVSLLLQGADALRDSLAEAAAGRDDRSLDADLLDRLAVEIESSAGGEDPAASPAAAETPGRRPRSGSSSGLRVSTIRVDVEKLDQLLTLTGEIAVARGRQIRLMEDSGAATSGLLEEHREADRLYMDLQELVMKLRMVPVGPLFERYARSVRDLGETHGKRVRLHLEGGEVEVDRSVLQLLRDPLTHLVRNAVDHGIEPPEQRESAGKDPTGTITLRAHHVAGSIVIELEDDGAGLDLKRILERARALGKVGGHEQPSARQLAALLFEPGFSTAAEVSDLSGRGVGMDVVRRNVEALRGSVELNSRPGRGTRVTIRLPLTLAIIEGLEVRILDHTYIIPLDAVVESVDLPALAQRDRESRGAVSVRGRTVPYVRLRELFEVEGPPAARENLVVVQVGNSRAGLVVDEVFTKSQLVIKPVAKIFQGLRGISGSAILGNGKVALILDVQGLLRGEEARRLGWLGSLPNPGSTAASQRLSAGG